MVFFLDRFLQRLAEQVIEDDIVVKTGTALRGAEPRSDRRLSCGKSDVGLVAPVSDVWKLLKVIHTFSSCSRCSR